MRAAAAAALPTAATAAPPPSSSDVVTPGERLSSAAAFHSGPGTHTLDGSIYASLTGTVQHLPPPSPSSLPLLSVLSLRPPTLVPSPGDRVLARVTKINPRYASLSILCIGSHPLPHPFPATLRQRDLRSFDVDHADVGQSVRPGDLVRCAVLSLGDARSYFVSTAEEEFGVVEATSAAGGQLRAVSWERMQCQLTGVREQRKVAKRPGMEVAMDGGDTATAAAGAHTGHT